MSTGDENQKLRAELKRSRDEVDRLRKENAKLKAMLEAFRVRPAASLSRQPPQARQKPPSDEASVKPSSKRVADARVQTFRSLFRGRDDVYAIRWESKKGKSGYSPACAHEWDQLICKKPHGKCTNCRYLPLSDDVVRSHLLGECTIGVYPLLKDDTCWFLTVDFDKQGWQDDVRVFLDTSQGMGVPTYLERSRSGNGAHAWIFFERPVPASEARKLGSAILTASMDKRHQVGLSSYDRLFPNQDTVPKGGFGNLIALPLQRGPRSRGNSVFLDDDFSPVADQWPHLTSIQRLTPAALHEIIRDAERRDLVLGVRLPVTDSASEQDPWTLPPSRTRNEPAMSGPLPDRLTAVRDNMLYLEKAALSPTLTNRIVRMAAFQNPEFYAAQAMRLSTFDKPRIIGCAEEFPNHIALPRGCAADLYSFAGAYQIGIDEKDNRYAGKKTEFEFHGQLRPEQEEAAREILHHDDGVLVAPPGFGKTVLAAWMVAQRNVSTLLLVHRTALLEQWREQLAAFLNLRTKQVGVIGSGRKRANGILDVAMLQSLQRKGVVRDLVAEYGFVIADECHHLSAFTFERIMKEVKAKYILGLTVTPIRKDGHHPIIFMQCGPIRHRVHARSAAAKRPFSHVVIPRETNFVTSGNDPAIHDIYNQVAMNERRNRLIVNDVVSAAESGCTPLVLTERVEHLELLAAMLRQKVDVVIALKGRMKRTEYKAAIDSIANVKGGTPMVIVATGRYIGEGFDYARLDALFLAMPISWRGTLEQYVGRLHRAHEGKREVRVYDYVDRGAPMLARMYAKRVRGYKAMGYTILDTNQQMTLLNPATEDTKE